MDELINNINQEELIELEPEVTPVSDNIINTDDCSIVIEEIGRRAYINSVSGRSELLADCTQYNRMDLYEEVLNTWGENPTIEDEVIPEKTFEELKQDKQNELNDAFNRAVKGSFTTTEGYKMQFDTDDSLKMQGAITLMETSGQTEGYLTQADDTTIYHVPLETMKAVLVEMLDAYAQCHARKQALRSQINAAQNEEELNAIEITWPV